MHEIEHAVIVLAAGSSKRLAYPKQLLTREREALVHRVVRIALETKPTRLLLVTGAYREAIMHAVTGLPVDEIYNPHHETGMASSIASGAADLHSFSGLILILGCDQPALELHHLQYILAGAKQTVSGYAALQYAEKNTLGIPAVLPAEDLKKATTLKADQGFRALFRANATQVFRIDAPELQKDLDTPEDIQYAITQAWIDEASQMK
jgi:molybdenum cofactor cytidylyltransferase